MSAAKNAVLPLMVAAMLSPGFVTLRGVPRSLDVAVLAALMRRLGAELSWHDDGVALAVTVCAHRISPGEVDGDLVSPMRASVLLLGALLTRCGQASLPLPGGDAIGARAIDYHLAGLRKLGAEAELEGGLVRARAPSGLRGARIVLPQPSVGATENLMLAASLAQGESIIGNAAREPEVGDLARLLRAMGAAVSGEGTGCLRVRGAGALRGAVHEILPDRIEFGTLACAAAATGGEVVLRGGRLDPFGSACTTLAEAGVELLEVPAGIVARRAAGGLRGVDVVTAPYPGFATDLQAPAMALLCGARGASAVTETVFENRFRHADELRRMGAAIVVRGRMALIRGVPRLSGASVTGTDVRAAAALLIAGLAASGETVLGGLDHLARGYDAMPERLAAVGAEIEWAK